ncbi:uncharacterized protein LOC105201915 [Solenopsis invicta]|uniref:uncharacterized protein LOC105201915 n=1 Tax=Solenopsis invicta TaxID=13686 RepID=UPI00193E55A2|nr:uncharacterized protein LOC105201915 [Solenopsis invicta]
MKMWWSFCKKRNFNFFAPSVPSFLEFLSSAFAEMGSYATLNTYRSAISLISTDNIGAHPLVKRFFKGVATLKPQRSRYDFVWDPAPVVEYLATLYPHEDLSLEKISRKLITLLALTTAQRMQTLAAIRISNMYFSDSLIIKIPSRLKTSGIGRSQPLLLFKPFLNKPEVCVFSLAQWYLKATSALRREGCDHLFISLRAPHGPVSTQTLARWVKLELKAAGIDTSVFSAHSTRHAATSLAASKGISLDEIRCTAGWSRSSDVFAQFYNRSILKTSSFQNIILSDT